MTDPATMADPVEHTPVAEDVQAENLRWIAALRGDGSEQHQALRDL